MKKKLKKILGKASIRKKKDVNIRFEEAVQNLPKITNDTVAEHREEVLSTARKYIYPLQHSKHRVVFISTSLFATAAVVFFGYCLLALYHFQSTSSFIYGVTEVIPFPIAKAGPNFVSYENYLFQLRHYIHYYQTQGRVNFASTAGQQQLFSYERQALQQVIDYSYIKQLAREHNISVSAQDINNEINLLRSENRLGANQAEFESVLSNFWGWTVSDFKRELSEELLTQKVVSALDTATHLKAQTALQALKSGTPFATVATQYSEDIATKANGGQFGFTITSDNQNLPAQTLNALLALKPGQYSGVINLGNALEIDEVISNTNGNIQAAHILFNFNNITSYIQPLMNKEKPSVYITIPKS